MIFHSIPSGSESQLPSNINGHFLLKVLTNFLAQKNLSEIFCLFETILNKASNAC